MFIHILGLDNANGHWYLFWSGMGSDIGEFALVGAILKTAINLKRQHEYHHKMLMTKLTENKEK